MASFQSPSDMAGDQEAMDDSATAAGVSSPPAAASSAELPPPTSSLPPPPADPVQAAAYDPGILMLLGVIQSRDKKDDECYATFRQDVKSEFDAVHDPVDSVEEEVARANSITAVCFRKVAVLENRQCTTENNVAAIDQRVTALESWRGGARPKTTAEVVESEISAVNDLLAAAKSMAHIVVVGCHGCREPKREGIADLVKRFTSKIEVRYDVRGLVARIYFGFDGTNAASQRAHSFFQDVISHQSNATYWAKVDEPRALRDLKARARALGEAVLSFCSIRRAGTDNHSYSNVNGFLLVGDVVVAPLTLLPGDDNFDIVVPAIGKVVLDPNHHPVNFRNPLGTQLRRGIAEVLVNIHQKPAFIDTVEDFHPSAERTVPVTEPARVMSDTEDSKTVRSSPEPESSSDSSSFSAQPSPEKPTRKRKMKSKQRRPPAKTSTNKRRQPNSLKRPKMVEDALAAAVSLFKHVDAGLPLTCSSTEPLEHVETGGGNLLDLHSGSLSDVFDSANDDACGKFLQSPAPDSGDLLADNSTNVT